MTNTQSLTNPTFAHKWASIPRFGVSETEVAPLIEFMRRRLGLDSIADLEAHYARRRDILEIGPGSGWHVRYMAEHTKGRVTAADITSEAVAATKENTGHLSNVTVLQGDVFNLPLEFERFDYITTDGVLHHTPDTKKALFALCRHLAPGGQIFFYVYRDYAPARSFCDDHIRAAFARMSPDEAVESSKGFTELGRELSKLSAKITLQRPIPELGIPAGAHDVQRLIYYYLMKCYWNDAFDYDTNNMVNFDWYHPHDAWRHTESEVEAWLDELGFTDRIVRIVDPNGISVLARKPQ